MQGNNLTIVTKDKEKFGVVEQKSKVQNRRLTASTVQVATKTTVDLNVTMQKLKIVVGEAATQEISKGNSLQQAGKGKEHLKMQS
jgi:hypothetical protein